MKAMLTLNRYEQLKAMSDPLRAEMMMRLIERPYTGQQLAELLNISRAKIHYHLKELAKNDLIEIVRKEEKNGIVQKFYQSVASGFVPATNLLPHKEEVSEVSRNLILESVERTRKRVISAPEMAFQQKESTVDPSDWLFLTPTVEVTATEEDFKLFVKNYHQLVQDLRAKSKVAEQDLNSNLYHISTYGFQVDDTIFDWEDND